MSNSIRAPWSVDRSAVETEIDAFSGMSSGYFQNSSPRFQQLQQLMLSDVEADTQDSEELDGAAHASSVFDYLTAVDGSEFPSIRDILMSSVEREENNRVFERVRVCSRDAHLLKEACENVTPTRWSLRFTPACLSGRQTYVSAFDVQCGTVDDLKDIMHTIMEDFDVDMLSVTLERVR